MSSNGINHTEDWVFAFQQGGEESYDFIFRQYFPALCFFAGKIIKDENYAKDIVQDCFVKLWSRHTIFTTQETIKSFLYTTVKNSCIDFLRKTKQIHNGQKEVYYLSGSTDDNWLDQVTHAEMVNEIYLHILSLPTRMQEVFRKYYIEGKTCKEIAGDLHTTPSTVRQQKARALELLKEKLGLLFAAILFFLS
jgi:RNA polymerase sigma-70 factor (family 1)